MHMTTCSKKCFCNATHLGMCEGLLDRVEDERGVCKFQKNHRNDTRHYIPVKLPNGLTSFMEQSEYNDYRKPDEQNESGRYIAVKLPNGLTTFMEANNEQTRRTYR